MAGSRCDPRPPRRRRPRSRAGTTPARPVAIHAPLAGGDTAAWSSPPAARVAIHAPLAGGDPGPGADRAARVVAIHAPLAGGDEVRSRELRYPPGCDPRPPRGRRPVAGDRYFFTDELRSTPPSREATAATRSPRHVPRGCDPRPPRGRRHSPEDVKEDVKELRSTPPSREATT